MNQHVGIFWTVLLVQICGGAARAPAESPTRKSPITAVAIARDGTLAVIGSQASVEIRTWPELELVRRLKTKLSHVHDLAISPLGSNLLVTGGSPGETGMVEIWSWPDGELQRIVSAHEDLIYRVTWSPDGGLWATASADSFCRVYSADGTRLQCTFRGHSRPTLGISFLDGQNTVVSAGIDQSLKLWESATGHELRSQDNHVKAVNDLAIRPQMTDRKSPRIVATAGEDQTVRFWQPAIGRMMRFAKLASPPQAIAWSADGELLVAGCGNGRIYIVDPRTADIVSDRAADVGRILSLAADPQQPKRVLIGGEQGAIELNW